MNWDGNGDPGQGLGQDFGQGFGPGDGRGMGHRVHEMYWGDHSGAHPILMVLCMIAFAVGVFLLLRLISRGIARRNEQCCVECKQCGSTSNAASVGVESPREILDRRFAQGKIKRKKYLAARDLLS